MLPPRFALPFLRSAFFVACACASWVRADPSFAAGAAPAAADAPVSHAACPALLDQRFPRLQDEAPQDLCQYAGKVVLVVNTASYCGYTHQYKGLEALYARYRARGLVVLGFPSNDFGGQEPGNAGQIADLCYNTYGVQFPMFAKSVVKGPQANPLYAALAKATGEAPGWNFHKYLIDRRGKAIATYPSQVEPDDPRLLAGIERALAQPM
ncbi:MAG: glutathione peroxidase [Burkholderiaceae bacterium]